MTARDLCPAALAARGASVAPGPRRVGPRLVHEDELVGVERWRLGDPGLPPCGSVVTVVVVGTSRLFFNGIP